MAVKKPAKKKATSKPTKKAEPKPAKKPAAKPVKKQTKPVKKPAKKPAKKPSKAAKSKGGKKPAGGSFDMGIVIVDDDIEIDKERVNEERRAYLEEARSQEASD